MSIELNQCFTAGLKWGGHILTLKQQFITYFTIHLGEGHKIPDTVFCNMSLSTLNSHFCTFFLACSLWLHIDFIFKGIKNSRGTQQDRDLRLLSTFVHCTNITNLIIYFIGGHRSRLADGFLLVKIISNSW